MGERQEVGAGCREELTGWANFQELLQGPLELLSP